MTELTSKIGLSSWLVFALCTVTGGCMGCNLCALCYGTAQGIQSIQYGPYYIFINFLVHEPLTRKTPARGLARSDFSARMLYASNMNYLTIILEFIPVDRFLISLSISERTRSASLSTSVQLCTTNSGRVTHTRSGKGRSGRFP